MKKYIALGHMTSAAELRGYDNTPVFLPHYGVLRESSATKLRVVFNGSSRTITGVSLNKYLHIGLKLQQDLDTILHGWRTHAFVFAADIEKMYRRILVHPEDRDFQQILWSATGASQEYQVCMITYIDLRSVPRTSSYTAARYQ